MKYFHKRILILGLAKSGFAAAKLLHQLGADVTVNDQKPYEQNEAAKNLEEAGINVICGGHPLQLLDQSFDLIVKNPGIPYNNPLIVRATEKKIPIITEVELAYQISEADFIGVTGSNGKTTTTTVIYEMLRRENLNPLIAGNIGTVACEVAQKANKENVIVTELSSFQLLGIESFKPKISVLINIFDAHLDYHGSKTEYVKAKGNIFNNQTEEDYCVVNADDQEVMELATDCLAQTILFSVTKILSNGAFVRNGCIFYNDEMIIHTDDVALPGTHNLENILAAVVVAKIMNVTNRVIQDVLSTFTGVKHRLQYVATVKGRKFYNDSKATNILATQKALTAFDQPIILLAGGLDRGNEFDELMPYLLNVKALITFGQTAHKLEQVAKLGGIEIIERVDNVEQAVSLAFKRSEDQEIILLSPACASWDQYKTFEERGDIFMNAVHKLK